MRTGTVKRSFAAFRHNRRGHSPVWSVARLWDGETLIAAVILSAFVVGIAWVGTRADHRFNRK